MELGELIAALGAHVADDEGGLDEEKLKNVVKELRGHESPNVKAIAQRIMNAGAARTKTDGEKRIKALEAEVAESKAAAEELTQSLAEKEANKGKPSEKEAALEKERDRWKAKAEKADTDLKAERDGRKSDRVGTKALSVVGELKGQVDEDYLAEVLTPRIAKRIRPTDEDVDFLADDETPYEGDDKTRIQALAADVLKLVPDKYRLRDLKAGGGVNGRGGQGAVTAEQITEEKARSREYMRL